MKIGIIGTGNIGGTLARKFKAAGHDIRVANSRGINGVRAFAEEIGAEPVDIRGAVEGADVIVLSIPLPALSALPADLFAAVPGSVPVVDTSNYYPGLRDPNIAEIDQGMTESVWVSKQIGRPVIKAFNNILAYTLAELGSAEGTPGRLAAAVAGDDPKAKETVMSLVNQAGFDPVDGGSLEESWRQQPCTPGYCCDYDAETLRKALLTASKEQAAAKRDEFPKHFERLGPNPSHADIVAMNRSLNAPD
ncbi:NADPH-dependent F420 reductase [Pseudomonas alvandae]|uniref:NADPH-dependent F420 reductase n=1 Tax=Pseudomonas TaxID=286 RepID=UPI00215ED9CB|nr:NAD(P)-binding domain-containing protein [Pseudomonas canavaninivorans]UVM73309.1 NAD(P)-binding domain-containing protein [Pseudomonas canavaninivorans]